MKRVLSKDLDTGVTEYFHSDPMTHAVTLWSEQDVSKVAEAAKKEFNSVDERARWGELTKVASIPEAIYYDLKKKGIIDDQKKFKSWLNDRDQRVFRTRPGRV